MRFAVTDSYDYHRPSKCRLRVYLRHHGVEEAPPDEFREVLLRLGKSHEARHLASLSRVTDLSAGDRADRQRQTLEAIRSGAAVIYQGSLTSTLEIDGDVCSVTGEPDFLVRTEGGYVIRDSKLARNIDEAHHPEILLQLQLYGWLFEQTVGASPAGLEVHAGDDRLVAVRYDRGAAALEHLRFLREARLAESEFYEPVGWNKCRGCGYYNRCWTRAEEAGDVALLRGVDQKLARKLHDQGVTNIHALAEAFERPDLRDLFYEKATKKKPERIKDSAVGIRRSVEAHETGTALSIGPVDLPDPSISVMLDLEGMPPYFDELEKVYLWGIKDFRAVPARYCGAQSGFGPGGDREGWEAFLRLAGELLAESPDMRFVHYGTYEKTKIDLYRRRYGDSSGTADRLLARLFDLHPAITHAVALPIYSYGLKAVEEHIRFTRRLAEANGEWAMARYIEATETGDSTARSEVLGQIKAYNNEDLNATWAVLRWLRDQSAARVVSPLPAPV